MARNRRSLLSDQTKMYLAQVQGAGDRVSPGDYGNLTSREAGSFTKYAIMAAEQALAGQSPSISATAQQQRVQQTPTSVPPQSPLLSGRQGF